MRKHVIRKNQSTQNAIYSFNFILLSVLFISSIALITVSSKKIMVDYNQHYHGYKWLQIYNDG